MLYPSYLFIFLFLPIVLTGSFLLSHLELRRGLVLWIIGASCVFYAWWYPPYLLVLLGSVTLNYGVSSLLVWLKNRQRPTCAKRLLASAIGMNLLMLLMFKWNGSSYSLLPVWGPTTSSSWMVPLGISFFMLQQIAYMVDIYRQPKRHISFLEYTLFITFFPHLVAGPIVYLKEMMPQFRNAVWGKFHWGNMVLGLQLFGIGLFKKTVLSSLCLSKTSSMSYFPIPDQWHRIEVIIGTIAYGLMLYFDFSGYSDMSVGLARILGIRLPMNFNSPFKATNMAMFWSRWHMTLIRFLHHYLYRFLRTSISSKKYCIWLIMGAVGLWHGFRPGLFLWGVLQGIFITRAMSKKRKNQSISAELNPSSWLSRIRHRLSPWYGRATTTGLFLVSGILFATPSVHVASSAFKNLVAFHFPDGFFISFGPAGAPSLQFHQNFFP